MPPKGRRRAFGNSRTSKSGTQAHKSRHMYSTPHQSMHNHSHLVNVRQRGKNFTTMERTARHMGPLSSNNSRSKSVESSLRTRSLSDHQLRGRRAAVLRQHTGTRAFSNPKPQEHKRSCRSKHRANRETNLSMPSSSSTQGAIASSSAAEADLDLEIPGFYYDKEKKKYFRILPVHNNAPSFVTRETLHARVAEEARQRCLEEFCKNSHARTTFAQNQPSNKPRCHYSRNNLDLLCGRMLGYFTPSSFEVTAMKNQVPFLRAGRAVKVFEDPMNPYEKLEHMTQIQPSADYSKFLCLWAVQSLLVQRIQVLAINQMGRDSESGPVHLDLKPIGTSIMQSFSKVSNLCWAPVDPSDNSHTYILYTTTCYLGNNPSLAMLRRLDGEQPQQFRYREFNLGNKATWTCAWNKYTTQFSIGSEKCAMLLDVHTRRMWELYTKKSDVVAQAFAPQSAFMLYSGTRSGHICGHDTRSNSTHFTTVLNHKAAINHVYVFNDEYRLLASDAWGQIKLWDLRKRQVVQTYKGNENKYTRIPLQVDQTESLVYAAGQDCYTRLWNLQDAKLLNTIPPPYPASRDLVPSLCYSSHFGNGRFSYPGLLMGIKDEIHFYHS